MTELIQWLKTTLPSLFHWLSQTDCCAYPTPARKMTQLANSKIKHHQTLVVYGTEITKKRISWAAELVQPMQVEDAELFLPLAARNDSCLEML